MLLSLGIIWILPLPRSNPQSLHLAIRNTLRPPLKPKLDSTTPRAPNSNLQTCRAQRSNLWKRRRRQDRLHLGLASLRPESTTRRTATPFSLLCKVDLLSDVVLLMAQSEVTDDEGLI